MNIDDWKSQIKRGKVPRVCRRENIIPLQTKDLNIFLLCLKNGITCEMQSMK